MKKIFLALLLLASAAQGATRLYLSNGGNGDAYESFTPDAGWEVTTDAGCRGSMHIGAEVGGNNYRGRNGGQVGCGSGGLTVLTPSSANQVLGSQYQIKLAVGATFTSGVTTVKMQSRMEEASSTDDVNQCVIGIRVISEGGTVRATLLAVANYGTTAEFSVNGATAPTNRTCANGDTVTASYTSVEGDYLVVEHGYANDGATGANSRASALLSDGAGYVCGGLGCLSGTAIAADCPENDTAQTACAAWIEFSNDFTRATETNGPPTQWWFPHDTAADITPAAVSSGWSASDEVMWRKLVDVKGSTTITDGQTVDLSGAFVREIDRGYVSAPLAAGNIFTQGVTTVNGMISGAELLTSDEILGAVLAIRIVSNDGSVTRATLLNTAFTGWRELDPSGANSLRNPLAIVHPIRDSYTTIAGDRLVVEVGFATFSGATTPQAFFTYGESVSDCPSGTYSTSSSECAPWITFSNNIALLTERHHAAVN